MVRVSSLSRFGVVAALLAGVLATSGCYRIYTDTAGVRIRLTNYRENPADKQEPQNQYLQFRGKGKAEPRLGFTRYVYEAYIPLDVQVTLGAFDVKRLELAQGAQGCLELDVTGSDPLEFATVCGFYNATLDGWDVTAGWSLGTDSGQSPFVTIPARKIDLRLLADGVNLQFWANQTLVEEFAYADDPGFQVGVGGFRLQKKGSVGFDDYVGVLASTPSPSPQQTIYDGIGWGLIYSWDACEDLDGPVFDFPSALDDIGQARFWYGQAIQDIQALPDFPLKEYEKSIKDLLKADGKLASAEAKIASGKAKGAAKSVRASTKKGDRAAEIFLTFPGQF